MLFGLNFILKKGLLWIKQELLLTVRSNRFVEIDALRGIAVLAMVAFHALFDYNFLVAPRFDLYTGPVFWLGRVAAVLFVGLFGASLFLRVHRKHLDGFALVKDFVVRGVWLFVLGLVLTVVSFLLFPEYTIWFGVLHFLGVASVLSILLVRRPALAGALGALIALFGIWLSVVSLQLPFWIPLLPVSFATFDFFPLFPWLGVVWLGIALGSFAYSNGNRSFREPAWNSSVVVQCLAWSGRRSIWIYFFHQPTLALWLFIFFGA